MTANRAEARQGVLIISALALGTAIVLGATLGWSAATGYVGGVVTGAGMLGALVLCVTRLVAPPGHLRGPRWPWLLLHLGKFAGAVALAWLLVGVLKASVAGFAGGYLTALGGFLILCSRTQSAVRGAR